MSASSPSSTSDEAWLARQRYWRRKLRRLRLDAEPIDEQVARYRRVTWGLTAVPLVLALMFVGLFTAFERTDVGIVIVGVFLVPIVALAWFDYALLSTRARRYQRELHERGRESETERGR
jgi:hypothetical protein